LYELKWLSILDREYLEDYEQKEAEEYEKLVLKRVQEGKFDFQKDRYPPDERFVNLHKPVTLATGNASNVEYLWAQVPFCGSLIIFLPPLSKTAFEYFYFEISEIPKIVDFIKETGRLQVVFNASPLSFEGLDHLDPFFKELNPPVYGGMPFSVFGSGKEIQKTRDIFFTLGKVRYLDYLRSYVSKVEPIESQPTIDLFYQVNLEAYLSLKLGHYAIVEDIENSMVDDPERALSLLSVCQTFIVNPTHDLRVCARNFLFEDTKESQALPLVYRPKEVGFPCEIGQFLLKKLTYTAQDMRACYDIIDHYNAYDLQKVQVSLNEAIVTNHPDIVSKNAEKLSEILDNVWNDPAIPRQIKNLKRGLPMSIAAIGTAVSAFTGGVEGFLAGLGFSVGAKFLDAEIEGLSERLVKFFARSYQANVYDFKKKYKEKIVKPRH